MYSLLGALLDGAGLLVARARTGVPARAGVRVLDVEEKHTRRERVAAPRTALGGVTARQADERGAVRLQARALVAVADGSRDYERVQERVEEVARLAVDVHTSVVERVENCGEAVVVALREGGARHVGAREDVAVGRGRGRRIPDHSLSQRLDARRGLGIGWC